MPLKAKLTKEKIILTSLEIVKIHGINGLTARELGKKIEKFS